MDVFIEIEELHLYRSHNRKNRAGILDYRGYFLDLLRLSTVIFGIGQ